MRAEDVIDIVQPFVVARLQSLDYFGDIMVAAPRVWKEGEKLNTPKSITEKVDQALRGLVMTGGKVGATVRVFQPTLSMKKTNGREALLMLVCRCEVNPIINFSNTGTNKYVSHIAYQVLRAIQGFQIATGFCTLFADGECFIPYVSQDRQMETVDILFQSNFAVSPMDMVITPKLALGDNGLVTLTNVTAGATIYYSSRSDIFPAPQVAAAKQYTAPVRVDSGHDVFWAAYLPGLAGSHVGFQTITY